MCSKKITGSLSRMAWISRPLASYGVDGTTTFSPGMWVKAGTGTGVLRGGAQPAPYMVRMTTGVTALPPNM